MTLQENTRDNTWRLHAHVLLKRLLKQRMLHCGMMFFFDRENACQTHMDSQVVQTKYGLRQTMSTA